MSGVCDVCVWFAFSFFFTQTTNQQKLTKASTQTTTHSTHHTSREVSYLYLDSKGYLLYLIMVNGSCMPHAIHNQSLAYYHVHPTNALLHVIIV